MLDIYEIAKKLSIKKEYVIPYGNDKAKISNKLYEEVKNKTARVYSTSDILSRFMEVVSFDDNKIEDIKNGKITYLDINTKENRILVVDSKNNAIAVYTKENEKLKFTRGLF